MYRERVWSTARTMYIISWNCILTGNLSQDDLGEPIMDVILEPGDLLYFPRGTFHQVNGRICIIYTVLVCLCMYVYVNYVFCCGVQAESLPDVHSLHITLSTYQKYTWGDMMTQVRQ